MSDLKKHLINIATASAKDHILWEINNKLDTWDTPESKREIASISAEQKAATDAYVAAGGLVTNRTFSGFNGGNLSHYDIDDAVTAHFGRDRVMADSESGNFFAYTDESVSDELSSFLKEKFPGLDFSVYVNDEPNPLVTGSNWDAAEKFLKEEGVTVDYAPEINIQPKSEDEVAKHLEKAHHHLLMTGLFKDADEVSNLLFNVGSK